MSQRKAGDEVDFIVKKDYDYESDDDDLEPRCFHVALPHSCGYWEIAHSQTKAEAVAQMEVFVMAAMQALEKLKALA